jgi:hypothetical protein
MATEFACAGKASFGQACLEDLTPYDGRQTEQSYRHAAGCGKDVIIVK